MNAKRFRINNKAETATESLRTKQNPEPAETLEWLAEPAPPSTAFAADSGRVFCVVQPPVKVEYQ